MINKPLVTVVCICYNHQDFVVSAIESVRDQTYDNIELIIVDDASKDQSQEEISNLLNDISMPVQKFFNKENIGHIRSFNKVLPHCNGEFIIDMAADDLLLPSRIDKGVDRLVEMGESYGVHYSDADIIDRYGTIIGQHDTRSLLKTGFRLEGDLFSQVLGKYFICPPTMMYRTSLLQKLNGYDEQLYYEDFDFWVRSSRISNYCFSEEVLVHKRELRTSKSAKQYRPGSKMLPTTLTVCSKAFDLCRTEEEYSALKSRILYEMKMSVPALSFKVTFGFLRLLRAVKKRLKNIK